MDLTNLPWQAWLYLRVLCDGSGVRLESAQALEHARGCGPCRAELERLAGRELAGAL